MHAHVCDLIRWNKGGKCWSFQRLVAMWMGVIVNASALPTE